jgi:hypothetical protein
LTAPRDAAAIIAAMRRPSVTLWLETRRTHSVDIDSAHVGQGGTVGESTCTSSANAEEGDLRSALHTVDRLLVVQGQPASSAKPFLACAASAGDIYIAAIVFSYFVTWSPRHAGGLQGRPGFGRHPQRNASVHENRPLPGRAASVSPTHMRTNSSASTLPSSHHECSILPAPAASEPQESKTVNKVRKFIIPCTKLHTFLSYTLACIPASCNHEHDFINEKCALNVDEDVIPHKVIFPSDFTEPNKLKG